MSRDDGKYSRIYWSVTEDEKFDGIREDVRLFGSWSLLMVVADMAWPSPAYVPPMIPKAALARLVDADLVDVLPGGRYKLRGLDSEREKRSRQASQSSTLRWERGKVEGGKPASRRTRFKVLERDGYRCRYCGRDSDVVALDVDHVIPVREGGSAELDNLVTACVDCNAGKAAHPLRAQPITDARASETVHAPNPRQDEERDENEQSRADAAVALHERLGTFPSQKMVSWLTEIANEFGEARVVALIRATPATSSSPRDYVYAIRDALRAEAHVSSKKEAEAEKARLEAWNKDRAITPEQRADNQRRIAALQAEWFKPRATA